MEYDVCKAALASQGWYAFSARQSEKTALVSQTGAIARQLGEIVPGRHRQNVEEIVPRENETAYANSLSERYGLHPQPLHTDMAHWPIPCRYLVMACVRAGTASTPTILLDAHSVPLSENEELACYSETFIVRNGRNSFYGYVKEKGRPFIRLDEGCMESRTDNGARVVAAFSRDRNVDRLHLHEWRSGRILVIDNWRMLHGRGHDRPTDPGRLLLRAMVR